MTVTVKMNTNASKCDATGKFDSNIRPNIYTMDTVSDVVKSGYTSAQGYARGYNWYVVKYHGGYSFVTDHSIAD